MPPGRGGRGVARLGVHCQGLGAVGGPLITATASHVPRPTPTRPPVGGGPAARPIRQNILDGHAPARDIRLSLALTRLSDAEAGVIHAFTLPPPWTAVKVLHQARGSDRKRKRTSFTELDTSEKSCAPFSRKVEIRKLFACRAIGPVLQSNSLSDPGFRLSRVARCKAFHHVSVATPLIGPR